MTETHWLAGDDLGAMAKYAARNGSERKSRLVGCGVCRVVWNRLVDVRSRRAAELAEQAADGLAAADDLRVAARRAEAAAFALDDKREAYRKDRRAIERGWLAEEDATADDAIRGAGGERFSFGEAGLAALAAGDAVEGSISAFLNSPPHPFLTVELLRDIFGNPFRPVLFDPSWRTDTALSLARVMYDTRDFTAMTILADALQDAGCENADILDHCCGTSTHVRGCWVVDLVLGKA